MSIGESMQTQAEEFRERYSAVKDQIGRVIVGHDDIPRQYHMLKVRPTFGQAWQIHLSEHIESALQFDFPIATG